MPCFRGGNKKVHCICLYFSGRRWRFRVVVLFCTHTGDLYKEHYSLQSGAKERNASKLARRIANFFLYVNKQLII